MATRRNLLFSSWFLWAGFAFGQLSPLMGNLPLPNTYPANWGPIATNTCAATAGIAGTFVGPVKTITGTGTSATMTLEGSASTYGFGAPVPCGIPPNATASTSINVAITISGTNTCYDGPQTLTAATGAFIYTFASSCTANYATALGQASSPYEIGSMPMRDASGNIWVAFGYGNGTSDVPQTVSARESTDGGHTFGAVIPLVVDTTNSCSSGSQCGINGTASGTAANGNLIVVTGVYDFKLSERTGQLWETIYNGSTWSPYSVATVGIPSGQPSTWAWCWDMTQMINLPGGALGLEAIGDVGPGPVNCGFNVYILVSCDNGNSWGTGTGCTGGMAQFAGTNSIILVAPASSGNWPTTESNIAWVGGTTLLGFLRNNQSTLTTPAPMIMFYSNDMGKTWTFQNTGIVGQAVGAATTTYTETSPWLYNTGIGGLWTLFYGDRPNSGSYSQIVRQITFNPQAAIANPLSLGVGQFLWGMGAPGALGTYPGVIRSSSDPYTVLVWCDEFPTAAAIRRIRQWSATYIPSSGTMTVQ